MSRHSMPRSHLLVVVLWTLSLSGLFVGAQDLSDLPGPGGTQLIRDLATGQFSLGLSSHMGSWLLPFTDHDPVLAARVLSVLSTVAAAVGATLLGTAALGRTSGTWAGLLTAAWAPAACMGWSFGSGTVAWGVTWFGIGFCAWACRNQRHGWVAVGALLAVTGTAVKSTAIPALVLLLLVPMWAEGGWRGRLRMGALVVVGAAIGMGIGLLGATTGEPFLLAPDSPSLARILPAAQGQPALEGMKGIFMLGRQGHPQGAFGLAVVLASIGVLVPGDRRLMRGAMLLVTLTAMAIIGVVTGPLLLPRYLVPASLGLVVLSGAALRSWPQGRVARNTWRGCAGVVWLAVTLDGIAYASAWSELRQTYITIEDHRFPPMPAPLADRYGSMSRGIVMESSQPSILGLMTWIQSQPGQPIATIPFRDRRETHAHVAAIASESPFSVVRLQSCCTDSSVPRACVLELIETIDEGGFRLVIPDDTEGIPPQERRLAVALRRAASAGDLPYQTIDGFSIWIGRGSGGGELCEAGRW